MASPFLKNNLTITLSITQSTFNPEQSMTPGPTEQVVLVGPTSPH